jgi:putative transposase
LAPRGETPILAVKHAHHQKLSIISGISLSPILHQPGLYFQTLPNDYVDSQVAALFVRELVKHLRGQVIVVWDNGPMHKGDPIRELLADFPRLSIEYLPPYAPELNPVEQLWSHVKYAELANFAPLDVAALDQAVVQILNHAKQDLACLRSFYKGTPLVNGTRIT